MTISIIGARVIDPSSGLDQITDLHLENGRILALGAAPAGFSASRTIQADGQHSVILNQVTYGIAVRMAVLSMAMSGQNAQRLLDLENAL